MRAAHRLIALLAVAAAACGTSSSGVNGNFDFSYASCLLGCSVSDHAIAAGGATVHINAKPKTSVALPKAVSSSNSQVAAFTLLSATDQSSSDVTAVAGQPGNCDLILLDQSGHEIDRVGVTVKATTQLVIDQAWGTAQGPTLLAGSFDTLHVTTKNGSDTLVGTGAVKFTATGSAKPGNIATLGDSFSFTGDPGSGGLAADCLDAHIVVPVTFVAPSAITAVTLSAPTLTFDHTLKGRILVTPKANATPVFDAPCAWQLTPVGAAAAMTGLGGTIAFGAEQSWEISGAAGSYTAVCTVGNATATLAVKIN